LGGRWGGVGGPPPPPARSAAVDPGPGGRLAVTELLARVAGSSVSLNCPCADQGGRHVDMVVGADHCGRGGVGVWRVAASRPLTALRQRPGHGWRSCWTRPTAWRRGRWVQVQRAQPTSQRCPALRARVRSRVGAIPARPPRAVRCWKGRVVGRASQVVRRARSGLAWTTMARVTPGNGGLVRRRGLAGARPAGG
jgi:hypothetical protein